MNIQTLNIDKGQMPQDSDTPKILIAIPTEAHGGCEYNAITFGADLTKNYKADVWVTFPHNDTLEYMADLVRQNGMNYLPLECEFIKSDNPERVAAQEKALWPILEYLKPDAVFVPLPWPKRGQGLISGLATVGVPGLVKFALVPEEWGESEFINPATKQAQNNRQIWFANSAYSSRLLEKHYGLQPYTVDYFHVGPIGLNRLKDINDHTEEAYPKDMPREKRLGLDDLKDTDFIITTVARLSVQKGYPYLLEAAVNLIKKYPSLRFVWVGDGDLHDKLKAEIKAQNLEKHFSLLGFRKDVREILRESNLFVLPTVYEGGCSQALLEAMEEDVPVVVSDTSAVAEVIQHKKNGLLAECRSAPSLERQITDALDDEDLRKRLVKAAAQTVKRFSAEVMFHETRSRLEKLLHKPINPRSSSATIFQKQPLPSLVLNKVEDELLVDLSKSKYLIGIKLRRGTKNVSDRIWMRKNGMFHITNEEILKAEGIFIAGSSVIESEAIQNLTISLNRVPLDLKIKTFGNEWSASAKIPLKALKDFENRGASFELTMPAEKSLIGHASIVASITIRKIAFRLNTSKK